MTDFPEVRVADLVPTAVTISRGFPTQRAVPQGDVRVMSIAALRSGSAPKYFATHEDISDVGVDLARAGDILIAIEGGTVGETLVVPEDVEAFVPSQQAATLRVVDSTRLDPWYLGAWLTTEPAAEQLRRLARGSGIQRIPTKELSSLVLRVPPIAEQRAISERFLAFETAIRSHGAVTACLEELRDLDLVVAFADATPDGETRGTAKQRSRNDRSDAVEPHLLPTGGMASESPKPRPKTDAGRAATSGEPAGSVAPSNQRKRV